LTLERYRERFTSIGAKLKDAGPLEKADPLEKFDALYWSLKKAPEVGLAMASQEHQRLKATWDKPILAQIGLNRLTGDQRGQSQWEQQFDSVLQSFHRLRFAMESVVRYLHASGDLLAQLVNSCGLLSQPLGEEECSLSRVKEKLLREAGKYPRLVSSLQAFSDSAQFKYVAHACNRMKHRELMPIRLRYGREYDPYGNRGKQIATACFDAFPHIDKHDKRNHEQVDLESLEKMAADLLRLGEQVVKEIVAASQTPI
jgi:hypothetical protein